MDRVGPPDSLGLGFAEPQRPYLAGFHQLGHGAHRLLDRHRGIDAVLVVEIDHIDTQPL